MKTVSRILFLLLIFTPAVGDPLIAQRPLSPHAPAPGSPPPAPATTAAPFQSYGTGLGVEADNGFVVSIANGEWRHEGHTHVGGAGSISSPWGEEMTLRYWFNGDGSFAVEYDGNATIHFVTDELGRISEIMSMTAEGVRFAHVGDRAQRLGLGGVDLWSQDVEPYRALLAQIARNHSPDFLRGSERLHRKLESTQLASPAGCAGDIIACTGAIIGWVATVPAIAAGCTAGTAVTLGAACLAAILAHEGASVAVVGACINAITNCTDHSQHGDPGDGCSGPGGTPE
jgi:hypothetical protein